MSALRRASGRQAAAAVILALGLGAATAGARALAAFIGLTLASLVALSLLVRLLDPSPAGSPDADRLLHWTVFAFALHLGLSVVLNAVLFETSDALTYHREAVRIVQHWQDGHPMPALPGGKEGFYYLLAGLFWLFGPHDIAGLVVNAALSAALVPLVSDLTRRLVGDDAAHRVPALVVLLPGLLLWTSQLLKEAAVLLLVALALSAAVRLVRHLTVSGLAVLTLALALLLTMRAPVGLVVAAGLMLGIALGRRSVVGGLAAGLAALILAGALVVASGVGYSGYKEATGSNLQQANLVRQDLATSANSGFEADTDISTPGRALSYLPRGVLSFMLGPFPWQLGGARELVALPDVVVWWALLPSLWRGTRSALKRVGRATLVPLLPAMITTVLMSLVVGNFGTVVRERSQVVILLVPFIALGLALRATPRGVHALAEGPETSLLVTPQGAR